MSIVYLDCTCRRAQLYNSPTHPLLARTAANRVLMARKKEQQVKGKGTTSSAPSSLIAPSTADLKLAYARANHAFNNLSAAEDARRLRCSAFLLQDQVDDLNESLWREQERAEDAEASIEQWQRRVEETEANLETVERDLRLKSRELQMLKVRSWSYFHSTTGSIC